MIGLAVIGYGYWGPNLARCLAETDGCQLVAIADASRDALTRAGKRHPQAQLFTDWQEILADPRVDAVAIATPVSTHFDIARAALQAGRHVLVEKPITENSGQARTLVDMAAQRGLTLMVDHTFIYSSAVRKMKELIAADALGAIYYYDSTRINLGLFQRDVNVVWDLAVHDLAILNYVLDSQPTAISATGVTHVHGAPENMAQVLLYLESGAVAHLNVNWLAPLKVRRVLVGGARKMIVWDDLEPSEKIKVYDRGVSLANAPDLIHGMRVNYRMGDMWAPQLSTAEPILVEMAHFIACIERGETPATDGRLGLHVVEMLEAATRSMKMRGHVVELTPQRRAS
ncbi:MAG TPA: Gfo/Idh/MocA family oxidoreductase [Phenylobacterium sp.]|nr:Gfo/Idh/MocA family oxidoreductase [Phenylobacterium sp.]